MTDLQMDPPAPPRGRSLGLGRIVDEHVAGKVGLWSLEPASGIAHFDAEALRVLDWNKSEVELRWADLQDAAVPRFRDALQRQLDEMNVGRDEGFVEFELGLRNGLVREVRLQWRRQRNLIMGALMDRSDDHRAVATEVETGSVESRLHVAEVAARDRSRLLAALGHEMRNSLNAVMGLGHRLRRIDLYQPLTEQHQRWLDSILIAGRSLSRLADDLVALGRAESRGGSVDAALQPLLPCLLQAWDLARAAGGDSQVTLHPPRLHDFSGQTLVTFDAVRLQQVLLNLLSNADKYNRPGGSIWTDVRLENNQCVIEIRDDGLGIAAHHLPRLFTDYFRADREGSGTPGAGLGLVVSNALIVAMGGALEAESAEDLGSTFRIRLKLAPQGHAADCDCPT